MSVIADTVQQLAGEPRAIAVVLVLAVVWFVIGWAVRHLTWTELIARERRKAWAAGVEAERSGETEAFWRERSTIRAERMTGDLGPELTGQAGGRS